MHETGRSGPVHWDDPEGRDGMGRKVGEGFRMEVGREDPLEKEMAIHATVLAWRIPWTERPGPAIVYGVAKSRT